jgi:2-phosphosulfolactate phosphatase
LTRQGQAQAVWLDQSAYEVRLEWGQAGLATLLGSCDAVVIVDVLSFSTCVDIAVIGGASVLPFDEPGEKALAFAAQSNAVCAGPRSHAHYSLSPRSLVDIPAGTRLVLPSPNGAALCLQTGTTPTFAACLRNADSVARASRTVGRHIAVIAAGERWPSGSLRVAIEDWLGAGAVIASIEGQKSPEAEAAGLAFRAASNRIESMLIDCVSGRELFERGFSDDVRLASQCNVSQCAPRLVQGAFVDSARC